MCKRKSWSREELTNSTLTRGMSCPGTTAARVITCRDAGVGNCVDSSAGVGASTGVDGGVFRACCQC